MNDDRKYRHRGYMDTERDSPGRRPSGPRPPRGEGPRGRGADTDKAIVFVCRACGEKRRDLEGIRSDSTCVRCGADLHACRQCAFFDTSARFECAKPIPARIPDKNLRNTCTFYAPAQSFDLAGTKSLNTPEDARAAFDRLFKK
jgi:hypothetical protein